MEFNLFPGLWQEATSAGPLADGEWQAFTNPRSKT